MSSTPNCRISSGAWLQCQAPPTSAKRVASKIRIAATRMNLGVNRMMVAVLPGAILTPTAPSAAFALGENSDDPITMYLNDVFTVSVNLAGLPGLSLPAGLSSDGLPLGLQVIGRPFDEETVFRVAGVLESSAKFEAKPDGVA